MPLTGWVKGGEHPADDTNDTLTKSDTEIGSELDLQATVVYNPNVRISLGYGHFWTGAVIEDARESVTPASTNAEDMDYAYLQLVANF